jgi:alanine racemase
MNDPHSNRLTTASIDLANVTHNLRLLQDLIGGRPLWPCIKANAYGHGAEFIGLHLMKLGYDTFCVADISETEALLDAGVEARYIVLSATLPEHVEALVRYDCEPAVCTVEMVEALAREAVKRGKRVSVHVKVDTGMGRVGIRPDEVPDFLDTCRAHDALHLRGIMSHFPRADEADKDFSQEQIKAFQAVIEATQGYAIDIRHMANSAAILDLSDSYFDAARPGIAIYGLAPSRNIVNPRVEELRPVMRLTSRVNFLKEVAAGVGLSYGHAFHTRRPSLIATVPVGYGDGYPRRLSNDVEVLVRGVRCPQVGHITMDMSLIDVTALRGQIELGDEVVLIGRQGAEEITADELAVKLNTINYEVVTSIQDRVPRVATNSIDKS